jgi:hypothetical protein
MLFLLLMLERRMMKEGDRVKFVGFNAQPYETVGTVAKVTSQLVDVKWDARPTPVGILHKSQVEVISNGV